MSFKKPSKELLELIKELKYVHTGEDRIEAMIFANAKAKKEYHKLTYKEIKILEERL